MDEQPVFQEIEGQQWFIYRQGMGYADILDGVTHVLVEEGTTSIEDRTFYKRYQAGKYESLQQVRVAKSVQQIGRYSFQYCRNLVSVEIPNDSKLVDIGEAAFHGCKSLTVDKMTLPTSLRRIGDHAFSLCSSLTQPNVPSQLESIGLGCYKRCTALKEVDLSHCPNLKRINQWTFHNCSSLKTFLSPPHLENIGFHAFRCTSLEAVVFPKTLQSIEMGAFFGCNKLQCLKFPVSLQNISLQAFMGCTALGLVELESVASFQGAIGTAIFRDCSRLHTVTWPHDTIPCTLWPRMVARLFVGNSGQLAIPEKNQISCLFSSFRANHEMLLSNQRNAPPLQRSSRLRPTVVVSKKKKG
eukprot:CAMPEP_0168739972 /NCGR_PEP_ID=MMETSP0724-20121128/11736_1 /TAXON_ID=265536 /ORGANISM="Amphiprora sp., Strain CCMP467" /LENGTH=355 /DNA_ID=CAMNT_0008787387 /DNA_START=61 /DNA_END=1128 /DNA_ORIENTATION=+